MSETRWKRELRELGNAFHREAKRRESRPQGVPGAALRQAEATVLRQAAHQCAIRLGEGYGRGEPW